ncbi:hypothetical protein [Saccharothrix sp. HUAS TT1]|uniref:hypothetical protein n=1 Tax=unclassified Saccharothrix TaxID=2593673 RepID=UPI00345B8D76
MGKAGRRKRRQATSQVRRDQAWLEERSRHAGATATAAKKPSNWFMAQKGGTQTLVVLGVIALVVGGHFFLWGTVYPALGDAVGLVPVVSTATGWLFGGGAFMAWGVLAINHETAEPATAQRLRVLAWSWTAIATMAIPTSYANGIRLPVDFWAGAYASAYGVILAPVAAGVVALGWWLLVDKLFRHKGGATPKAIGWICVGYATLLLIWGSTLLRA